MLKIWFMDIFVEKLLEEEFENLLEAKKNHKNDKKKITFNKSQNKVAWYK